MPENIEQLARLSSEDYENLSLHAAELKDKKGKSCDFPKD